jgi:hypothetical protein
MMVLVLTPRCRSSSLLPLPVPLQGRTNAIDPVSAIYSLVRDWASGHKTLIVKEEEILPQVMPTHPLRAR